MSPDRTSPADAGWRQAWSAALDELELDVAAVEAMLIDAHRAQELPPADPWSPPEGLGPLPLDLRPRADAILERQLAAAVGIARALATTRRQAAVAARIDTGRTADRPAYLDCAL
jgi:hypothetical protein